MSSRDNQAIFVRRKKLALKRTANARWFVDGRYIGHLERLLPSFGKLELSCGGRAKPIEQRAGLKVIVGRLCDAIERPTR